MKKWTILSLSFAVALLMACSKNSSTMRIEVYYVEALSAQEFPVSNATVTLKLKDEVHEIGKSNSLGIINFSKLPKSEEWSVSSEYTLNGIHYTGTMSGIKTDGRTGTNGRLYLRD